MVPESNPAFHAWPRTFVLATLVLYLLPFALVRIPSFERWGGSAFGPALDYAYNLPHQDADIVIFGDSSAAVGIDPRQLSAALGLKAINLPNTGASLHVVGDASLRRYLALNKPPRLIVLYFAAWNLDYAHEPAGPRIYEGEEILARRGSLREIAGFVRKNPLESLRFPLRFYLTNLPNALRQVVRREDPVGEVAATQGYSDPLFRRPPLPAPCEIPAELLRQVPLTTAQTLIETYRSPRTQVLFVVAPMPACSNAGVLTSRSYQLLNAGPVQVLPISSFKMDFAYVHLRPPAVPANTAYLATSIRAALQSRGAP